MKYTIDTDKHLRTIKKAYSAVEFEIGTTQNWLVETRKHPQHHDEEHKLIHDLKQLIALKKLLALMLQFGGKFPVSEENYQLMVAHQNILSDIRKLVSTWHQSKQELSGITEEDEIAEEIEEEEAEEAEEAEEVLDGPAPTEHQMMNRLAEMFQRKMAVAVVSDTPDSKKYMKRAVMNRLFFNARAQFLGAEQADLEPQDENLDNRKKQAASVSPTS